MPRRLLERCQLDSVGEFRAAALQRYQDGLSLAAAGRRTGAIYLWGYTAEMVLKAAFFSFAGLAERDTITWALHLKPAISKGVSLGISWPSPGAGHNVRAWAELLVLERAAAPAAAYTPAFGLEVQRQGQRLEWLWRETLRYHKNIAYPHEVMRAREAAEWLLTNSHLL
ncbi:MAG TPA: hypothetical protein VFE78_09995 [Gemmataceae bacterium]|jgi:hypothetical protein|nr:hypothetical protein [Gemmataceae bacterium]